MKIKAIINARVGNPVIPRRIDDPAGQFSNLRNANAQLKRKYARIKKGVREMIVSLKPIIVTNAVTYDYQVDSQKYNSINLYLQQLLYGELLDGNSTVNDRWWLSLNLTDAYTDGTSDALKSAKNIAVAEIVGQQISSTIRSTQLEQIVFSQGFSTRVGLLKSRVFENMKGLTDSTKANLSDVLARGMYNGDGIKKLTKDVLARVDVSHSRAKRIARTEVLNAYRTATSAETDVINDDVYGDSGYEMTMLWWSALSMTTRKNHASRHSLTYSTKEITEFYSINANSINCLCSQSPVLINTKTGEILQKTLQDRMKKRKEVWQKSQEIV